MGECDKGGRSPVPRKSDCIAITGCIESYLVNLARQIDIKIKHCIIELLMPPAKVYQISTSLHLELYLSVRIGSLEQSFF